MHLFVGFASFGTAATREIFALRRPFAVVRKPRWGDEMVSGYPETPLGGGDSGVTVRSSGAYH